MHSSEYILSRYDVCNTHTYTHVCTMRHAMNGKRRFEAHQRLIPTRHSSYHPHTHAHNVKYHCVSKRARELVYMLCVCVSRGPARLYALQEATAPIQCVCVLLLDLAAIAKHCGISHRAFSLSLMSRMAPYA